MEMLIYGTFSVVGYFVLRDADWLWETTRYWEGMGENGELIPFYSKAVSDTILCYYLLYMTRYCAAIVSVLLEHKRKDFVEMIVHHFVTVLLILVSFVTGNYRAGCSLMILFDPADVPLHVAKQFKYLGQQTLADISFAAFFLLFLVMRMILYPFVVYSCTYESKEVFSHSFGVSVGLACIYVLALLNCYWFFLILRVLIKLAMGGVVEDIRSDDEDEDGVSDSKKSA